MKQKKLDKNVKSILKTATFIEYVEFKLNGDVELIAWHDILLIDCNLLSFKFKFNAIPTVHIVFESHVLVD